MKTLRIIYLFTTMICSSIYLNGQTELIYPVEGEIDNYDWKVEFLSKPYDKLFYQSSERLIIRFIKKVVKNFDYDYIVEIKFNADFNKYYLIYRTGKLERLNGGFGAYKILEESRNEIAEDSAELIKTLFRYATLQTAYVVTRPAIIDGVDYHFTIGGEETRTAKIYSPKQNSRAWRFTNFGEKLMGLAENGERIRESDLEFQTNIKNLIKEFK